jgi:hypothetical protein
MADLITTDDLSNFPGGSFSPGEDDQVAFLIRFASAYVRRHVKTIDADIASGALDPDLVVGVLCGAIVRALEQARSGPNVKRTVYPEVETEYFEPSSVASMFYLTDEELDLLTTDDDDSSSGAFVIRVG